LPFHAFTRRYQGRNLCPPASEKLGAGTQPDDRRGRRENLFATTAGGNQVDPRRTALHHLPVHFGTTGYPGANKNHNGGANMIFCDAHVQYARQSVWLDPGDENQCLWNADNQSHPEFQ